MHCLSHILLSAPIYEAHSEYPSRQAFINIFDKSLDFLAFLLQLLLPSLIPTLKAIILLLVKSYHALWHGVSLAVIKDYVIPDQPLISPSVFEYVIQLQNLILFTPVSLEQFLRYLHPHHPLIHIVSVNIPTLSPAGSAAPALGSARQHLVHLCCSTSTLLVLITCCSKNLLFPVACSCINVQIAFSCNTLPMSPSGSSLHRCTSVQIRAASYSELHRVSRFSQAEHTG